MSFIWYSLYPGLYCSPSGNLNLLFLCFVVFYLELFNCSICDIFGSYCIVLHHIVLLQNSKSSFFVHLHTTYQSDIFTSIFHFWFILYSTTSYFIVLLHNSKCLFFVHPHTTYQIYINRCISPHFDSIV